MRCISCNGRYDAGTCKKCHEDLKKCHEDLKAKVAFLTTSQPDSFSDVILFAANGGSAQAAVPVPAHKAVLVSRSPVFNAILENEMEESLSGTIKIRDVSYGTLRAFVNYLYTTEVVCLDQQLACDLLVMAEKYQVHHLKDLCQKFLVANLNWENSFSTYTFVHQHNAKKVIDAALTLIIDNMDKLTAREEYAELKEKDPQLVFEIYEAYLSKQVNKAAAQKGYTGDLPLKRVPNFSFNPYREMYIEDDDDLKKCISCNARYDAGTCKKCNEDIKKCHKDLKAKVAFLTTSQPDSFSDVVLFASDGGPAQAAIPVPAHKAVLVSRSPVFNAMLENEMEESLSGTIKICDVSYGTLHAFVNYLYTSEVVCIYQQLACDLFVLAKKYQVQHLKNCCEKFLVSNLNLDNSLSTYTFAHQHNAKPIIDAALTLITNNMDKLTAREEYAELKEKYPILILEIYVAYLSKLHGGSAPIDADFDPEPDPESGSYFDDPDPNYDDNDPDPDYDDDDPDSNDDL
ncbi:PREDICTED: uncharacterized protein LOC103319894 [Prunus mume]|uniref:Uncharacterized protein LOC103319894 n=1 Tax=Prunus mume TaxID=102107 RepID=A0ABM0N574_PRUMU|nr:PREDICTED: uncharacterized protein LOC103319894 [Prunus mume]